MHISVSKIENCLSNLSKESTIHGEGNLRQPDGDSYIEIPPIFCPANQWTGFYIVGDKVRN